MAKIILSTKYLKGVRTRGAGSLLRYMGTRKGVETLDNNSDRRPVSKRQDELIRDSLNRFPEVYFYPEFNTFLADKTRANASELIEAILERNADKEDDIGGLIHYYAERPGVEKIGSHGLFSDTDEDIDLEKVAEEVSQVQGIIFTEVVSLRREDASRLGYDNADAWKGLVRRNLNEIAEAHKIPISELNWYAAFHNTAHHPHIHLMVYSDRGNGYISKKGYLDLKSALANDIFRNEQYKLFKLHTDIRNELKNEYFNLARQIMQREPSDETVRMFMDLAKDLSGRKGKMIYGYLPKSVKKKVDNIVKKIAEEPEIKELYAEWNRLNREKLSVYYDSSKDEDIPIEDNVTFRSLKNIAIQFALKLDLTENSKYQTSVDKTNVVIVQDALGMLASAIGLISNKRIDDLHSQIPSIDSKEIEQQTLIHGKPPATPAPKKEKDEEASEIAAGNAATLVGIGIAMVDAAVSKAKKAEEPEEEEYEEENNYDSYEEPQEEIHYYKDGTFSIGDSKNIWREFRNENGETDFEFVCEMDKPFRATVSEIEAMEEDITRHYYEDGTFSYGYSPEIWEIIGQNEQHEDVLEFRGYVEEYEAEEEDEGWFMSM